MQIHEIKTKIKKKKTKRVGRGGKRGITSGKGQKGQKARAGHKIRPAERDIFSKFPKLRGIKNRRLDPINELKLSDLEKIFEKNEVVDKKNLVKKNIIKYASQNVKIISGGKITKPVVIKGIKVSKGAKDAIQKAGGSFE